MNTRRFSSLLAASIILGSSLALAARADDVARPDLTGHWVLNEKKSDQPRMGGGPGGGPGGMRPEGGGRRGGGMRGGGGGGRGGERGGEPGGERRGPGGPGGGRMGLPSDMVVELADSELTVSERGLAVRRLEFDGATPAPAADGGTPVPSFAARWEGARIVSEFESRRGGTVRETWELSKDGNQLVVRTQLPSMGDRPGMEFKRVYDRSEP